MERKQRIVTMLRSVALACFASAVCAQSSSAQTKFPAAIIVLKHTGFFPAAITHHPGPILLIVHNASGVSHVSMHIVDAGGKKVHDLPAPNHSPSIITKSSWQELVTLSPGQYSLIEDAHPNWVCQINIK